MKSKSYFVDRIIKLRGGEGNRDELMKLQMVDILRILNEERLKQPTKKPENDDIADMIPDEKEEEEPKEEEPKEEEPKEEEPSDSDEESVVSIVKRFLFTPAGVKE